MSSSSSSPRLHTVLQSFLKVKLFVPVPLVCYGTPNLAPHIPALSVPLVWYGNACVCKARFCPFVLVREFNAYVKSVFDTPSLFFLLTFYVCIRSCPQEEEDVTRLQGRALVLMPCSNTTHTLFPSYVLRMHSIMPPSGRRCCKVGRIRCYLHCLKDKRVVNILSCIS